MKHILLFLSIISTASCAIFSNATCEKARKYRVETEIDNIVEYFTICQYRTPDNFDEIRDFVDDWKRNDSEGFCFGDDLIKFISKERQSMVSFKDSVFIFFPKRKIGCCVYGTPYYWFEYPDRYPEERMDYNYNFKTSAFDDNNDYMFAIDYPAFEESVKEIKSIYKYELLAKRPDCKFDFYYPIRAIITLDLRGGGSTVRYQDTTTANIRPISDKQNIGKYNGDIQADTKQYIRDVTELAKTFFGKDEGVNKVIIPVGLRL